MNRLFYKLLIGWTIFLAVACPDCLAEAAGQVPPNIAWKKSVQSLTQAGNLVRQRRLTEALGVLARSRLTLQEIRKTWPRYRRLHISAVIRAIAKEKANIYQLVETHGLVDYHGKFYTFEQMQQILTFQQERTERWMELLKAKEEIRRLKTEYMVKEESKRPAQSPPRQPVSRPEQKRKQPDL